MRSCFFQFICPSPLLPNILLSAMHYLSILVFVCWLSLSCSTPSTPDHKDEPSSEPTLILWHALRGSDHQNLKNDLARFESDTGITVTALQLPHNAFANKLQVSIPRGNGPDLFIGPHDRVGDWAEAGHIEPISFWMNQQSYQAFMKAPIEAFTYRQQLYGLPLSCKALALFYNPKLIKEPPSTIEILIDHMQSLNKRGSALLPGQASKIWGLAYPEIDSLYFHAPWLHAFRGRVLRGKHAEVDSKAMLNSIELVKRLRDQKFIPPEIDGALSSELFRRGQLAFLINGPWFLAELSDFDPEQWAVAPLPRLAQTQEPLRPYLSVEGVMVSSRTKQAQKAWTLAQYLASKELAQKRQGRGELIAYHPSELSPSSTQSNPWHAVFQSQVQEAIPLSNHPNMKSLWTPIKRALGQSILYGIPTQKALSEAQQAIERIIKEGVADD